MSTAELSIGLAIPAWRNIEGLRTALEAARRASPALLERAVVVDDSGDGRVAAALQPDFRTVRWRVHEANQGFGRTANEAVAAVPADIAVLMNDDAELLTDPAPALKRAFHDPTLFAVTFRAERADGSLREGAKRLAWSFGFPRVLHNERDQHAAGPDGARPSDYAVGGHAAFQRERFLELGGFDPLYEPFYWEDVDLSRRALGREWRIIYRPECRVRHAGESAIRSAHDTERIREITQRNRLLFAWRHAPAATRPLLRFSVAMQTAAARFRGDATLLRAFAAARARRYETRGVSDPAASISRAAATTSAGDGPAGR